MKNSDSIYYCTCINFNTFNVFFFTQTVKNVLALILIHFYLKFKLILNVFLIRDVNGQ